MIAASATHAGRPTGSAATPGDRPAVGVRGVVLLFGAAAALMLMASSAAATCGDYVVVRGEAPGGGRVAGGAAQAMRMAFPAHGSDAPASAAWPAGRTGGNPPCDGPRCEDGGPSPNAPLPAPVRDTLGRHVARMVAALEHLKPMPVARLRSSDRCCILPGYLDPIEPPPRS